jgi:hypothetical protein
VPCVVCSEGRKANELAFVQGELDDSGIIDVQCPSAHHTAVIYDARRYEVLLRSGGKALLGGFANEAIASLAAALERAYEFYIKVLCRKHGLEEGQVASAWKDVSVQSERQLGAFGFLFLVDTGKALPLDKRIPAIRNRIVHQGRIARESEAREFGALVFERIREIERGLVPYADAASAQVAAEMEASRAALPGGMKSGVLRVMSLMAHEGQVVGPVESFDDYLKALAQSVRKGLA